MKKTYTGWALVGRWTDGSRFFCGRYWVPGQIPPHMEGHIVALFDTRARARDASAVGGRTTIKRVTVTVSDLRKKAK